VPLRGDEKTTLHISLDRHRDAVLWKLETSMKSSCAGL
jgi:hypothetical protein